MAPHFICFALHSLLYPSHGAGLICKRARARRIGALSLSTGRTKEAPREGRPRSLRAREGGTRAEWREDGGRPGLRTVAAPASVSRAFLVVEALARPARALARGARCPARERPAHNLQVFASLPLPSSFHPPPRPLKVRRDLLHACALGRLPARWIGHLSSWAAGERREEIEGGRTEGGRRRACRGQPWLSSKSSPVWALPLRSSALALWASSTGGFGGSGGAAGRLQRRKTQRRATGRRDSESQSHCEAAAGWVDSYPDGRR